MPYQPIKLCLRSFPTLFDVLNLFHGPLARYVNCGSRMRQGSRESFPRHRLQRKPLVIDTSMHHGTCATHVPWGMSGSITCGGVENVPGIFMYLTRGPLRHSWYASIQFRYAAFLPLYFSGYHWGYSRDLCDDSGRYHCCFGSPYPGKVSEIPVSVHMCCSQYMFCLKFRSICIWVSKQTKRDDTNSKTRKLAFS